MFIWSLEQEGPKAAMSQIEAGKEHLESVSVWNILNWWRVIKEAMTEGLSTPKQSDTKEMKEEAKPEPQEPQEQEAENPAMEAVKEKLGSMIMQSEEVKNGSVDISGSNLQRSNTQKKKNRKKKKWIQVLVTLMEGVIATGSIDPSVGLPLFFRPIISQILS